MKIITKIRNENKRTICVLGMPVLRYTKHMPAPIPFKSVGDDVVVQTGAVIHHPENIIVGNNVRIAVDALIEGMGGLIIGNNVVFGPAVTIWTANHDYECPTSLPYDSKVVYRPVTIEDNVWLGGKAIILPGVTIHEGAVIGMGAVVTKDVPCGAVVGGNPARVLKYRDMNQYEKLKRAGAFYIFSDEYSATKQPKDNQ